MSKIPLRRRIALIVLSIITGAYMAYVIGYSTTSPTASPSKFDLVGLLAQSKVGLTEWTLMATVIIALLTVGSMWAVPKVMHLNTYVLGSMPGMFLMYLTVPIVMVGFVGTLGLMVLPLCVAAAFATMVITFVVVDRIALTGTTPPTRKGIVGCTTNRRQRIRSGGSPTRLHSQA